MMKVKLAMVSDRPTGVRTIRKLACTPLQGCCSAILARMPRAQPAALTETGST